MTALGLEKSLELRLTAKDTYENVHQPWTWRGRDTVPGSVLMSAAAAAAYKTVDEKHYTLDTIQAQFLAAPDLKKIFSYAVERLSNGKRFTTRRIVASQDGKAVFAATISFVSDSAESKPAITHTVRRETTHTIDRITVDDLAANYVPELGPWMKFQRLAVHHPDSNRLNPHTSVTVCAAHISPAIDQPQGHLSHLLGIINLSDYHVLDVSLQLNGITFGPPTIAEPGKPTKNRVRLMTSLNHTIHFHKQNGFRADEMFYIEAKCPWAENGRALVQTRIFSHDGVLIASCVQETFIMLMKNALDNKL